MTDKNKTGLNGEDSDQRNESEKVSLMVEMLNNDSMSYTAISALVTPQSEQK